MDNLLARPDIGPAESPSSSLDEFDVRPDFVDAERLREQFGCGICADVVLQPHQTSCGKKVCKGCIDDQFCGNSVIPCPVSHDDFDEEELGKEECQQEGLHRNSVFPDRYTRKLLLQERVFCGNRMYGCCEEPQWKKLKAHRCDQVALSSTCRRHFANGEQHEQSLTGARPKRVLPLEKATAEIAMKVKKLTDKVNQSETSGYHLVNAMGTMGSQQTEAVQRGVCTMERHLEDAGQDTVPVIESIMQDLKRHSDREEIIRNVELCSYDGNFIWKINDYKRRKSDAIRGRQMSIYSHPFYTSRFGYKMCCRAYLNGDGLGTGKYLSLFFVLMKGEYDELLHFAFKQRVTFSLLCPSNPSMSKHETFLPDPDSSSFRRPQTEMNVASGCPQFALHGEVESSSFLVGDCIYVRIRVEPGGDMIS